MPISIIQMSSTIKRKTKSTSKTHHSRSKTAIKIITQWGYKRPPQQHIVRRLRIHYRPETTDEKVIEEVIDENEYQKKKIGFVFEPEDVWLDLGANIGTFALFVLSMGASVICVEPEPSNLLILKKNLQSNFKRNAYRILQCGVATKRGKMPLYLCKGEYNKYRHSMMMRNGRKHISVDVQPLDALWHMKSIQTKQTVNAIKMDIEGMEIELLEKYAHRMKHLKKLVFEYTFDADPSIPRFMNIIQLLQKSFRIVKFKEQLKQLHSRKETVYNYYPLCTTVFCFNPSK